jgi:hypothetical protein
MATHLKNYVEKTRGKNNVSTVFNLHCGITIIFQLVCKDTLPPNIRFKMNEGELSGPNSRANRGENPRQVAGYLEKPA